MAKISTEETKSGDLVSVELPIRYWVIILASLQPYVKYVQSKVKEMRSANQTMDDVEKMSEEDVTVIVGTLFSQGAIVDALIDVGAMNPERADIGAKEIKKQVDNYIYKRPKSKKPRRK